MKTKAYLMKMGIRSQHMADAQFLHHGEAGQVGKRNAGFVAITEPQAIGVLESLLMDGLDDHRPRPLGVENSLAKCLLVMEGRRREQARNGFIEHVVSGHP